MTLAAGRGKRLPMTKDPTRNKATYLELCPQGLSSTPGRGLMFSVTSRRLFTRYVLCFGGKSENLLPSQVSKLTGQESDRLEEQP